MRKPPFGLAVFAIVLFSPFGVSGGDASEEAMKLHQKAFVFDAHCDTAMRLVGEKRIDLGVRQPDGHLDLPRAREGGLDAQIFAVWIPPQMPEARAAERAHAMVEAVWEQARAHPDRMEVARKGSDLRRIAREGKLGALIGLEGGHIIGSRLEALDEYYERGVRCMTLTWMNTNAWADASDDTARWGGLTDFGRAVVREMDRLGMIIDCSHVSEKTLFDVLETTKNPVLVSHSCMRALVDIPRNVSDAALRAVARNGGVVCVNFYAGFLDKEYNEKAWALHAEYRARAEDLAPQFGGDAQKAWESIHDEFEKRAGALGSVPLERLIDHIDHAVKVAGADHVGLGSDFDGISATPVGLDDASKLPLITGELRKRGYSGGDIKKILGGNLLKLAEKVVR